jgi:uncharacterized repeat protein (TIGR02543 family)
VTSYYLSTGYTVTVTPEGNGSVGFAVDGDDTWPHFTIDVSGELVIYVPAGSVIEMEAIPDAGHFTIWNEGGAKLLGDPSFTVNGDRTLTVRFMLPWDVIFESNGGSSVTSQTVEDEDLAVEPADPTRAGWTFRGWYSDAGLTTLFTFDTPIIEDTTLYAMWERIMWDVVFESNGGSSVTSQEVGEGDLADEPADPVRDGWVFRGWYSDTALTVPFTFDTPIIEDTTLYAMWEKVPEKDDGLPGWVWIVIAFFGLIFLLIFLDDDDEEEKKKK